MFLSWELALSSVSLDETMPSHLPSPEGNGPEGNGPEDYARRLAVLHRQSSVLAHDFNNLLTIIVGATEKLSAEIDLGAEQHELAEIALRAAERGSELLGRMLALSLDAASAVPQVDSAQPVECAQVLQDILVLIHHAVPETVEIWTSAPSEPLNCVADATGLEGALLNLSLNASHAMPQGGLLRIDARAVDLRHDAAQRLGVEPGPYVALSVRDNGCGMSDQVLARATEPLFTTRGETGGAGLGLVSVSDFARALGGALTLASREGLGTSATLYLPRSVGRLGKAEPASIAA
jgi:signal transduction histidine kinase